jgi:hypothetical protein
MKYYLGGVSLLALFACAHAEPAQAQQSTVVTTCGTQSIPAGQGTSGTYIDATGNLCTNASGGGGGGNVNLTGINGVTPLVGAGATGTGSPRTTQAQDTTTIAGAAPLTTGIYVTGPSAAALATSANQSSVIGTKAPGTAATNSLLTGGVYNSTPPTLTNGQQASAQLTAAGSAKVLDDNSAALLAAAQSGTGSTGSAVPASAVLMGGRAATAAPTAVTDGQLVAPMMGADGKQVVLPYSIKELAVRGTTTSTDTSAHTIIASAGGSLKNYITALQCGRTDAGATAIVLTLSDAASTVVILPSGGATNILFPIPLATAAATAFQVTSGTGVSTLYCSAQGYTGL